MASNEFQCIRNFRIYAVMKGKTSSGMRLEEKNHSYLYAIQKFPGRRALMTHKMSLKKKTNTTIQPYCIHVHM